MLYLIRGLDKPRRKWDTLCERVGRRGMCLIAIGWILIVGGQQYISSPPKGPQAEYLQYIVEVMPICHWGIVWVVAGLLCIFSSFFKKLEPLGFGIAEFLLLFWGFAIAFAFAAHGYYRSIFGSSLYLGMACLFLVISGWNEKPKKGGD